MKNHIRKLFDEFIDECKFSLKRRPETLRGYMATFDVFMKLMPDVSLEKLVADTMTEFFKRLEKRERFVGRGGQIMKKGVKTSTVATYRSKLHAFFEWLRIKGYIKENPFRDMLYPTPRYEDKKFLYRRQIEMIVTSITTNPWKSLLFKKRNLALVYIAFSCGLRKSELINLKVIDIDIEKKWLRVRGETSKSKIDRFIPINSDAFLQLKDYMDERYKNKYETPYLFVSNAKDALLTSHGLKHLVEKLKEISGVKFHMHQFRHTFAVNHVAKGTPLAKLQQMMGHRDIRMTQAYTRCIPTSQMEVDVEKVNLSNLI